MNSDASPWRRLLGRARRAFNWVTGLTLAGQVVVMLALSINDVIRRRHRKVRRFPTVAPEPFAIAGGNRLSIYTFGQDLYDDMLDSINAARDYVYFETYIWKSDEVGQQFKDALIAASERGVRVHVVYDVFGNMVVDPRFFEFPASVQLRRHPLISSPVPSVRMSGRDHRKMLVVDGHDAYLGGYNIGSLYADRWRDTHMRVQGPAAGEIENAFVDYWNMKPVGLMPPKSLPKLPDPDGRGWDTPLVVHRNTPRWRVYPIRNMYLEAIDRAEHRILLTHAYLIPDDDLTAALFAAARRGVDVRIIVPAQSNHVVADWLSRGFYDELLSKGVRLFLFQGAMVHAKTATIDGVWSTIGTANLDRLSLSGNYEANAEFTDPAVATKLEQIFESDLTNCIELTLDQWRSRSKVAQATEAFLAPWRPVF
ncbi:phospholipase D-like domain-containing protein [Propionibacteriaceae bacterium G1746]|uniref:phospholipase D-like domain-containing protein n=1 Tax=Aestuariimicrobium sp. G57 TaxID=3418485 RepID=UPI003C16304E